MNQQQVKNQTKGHGLIKYLKKFKQNVINNIIYCNLARKYFMILLH